MADENVKNNVLADEIDNTLLHNTEKLSLSNNLIRVVPSKTVPRKTDEAIKANVKVLPIDECVKLLKKGKTYYEFLNDDCFTKVYLDIEHDDYEEQPSQEELDSIKQSCICDITKMFEEKDKGFDADKHIAIAQRHRWITKNDKRTFKVSFRFWITRYAIKYSHIPSLLKMYGYDKYGVLGIDRMFDLSCYNESNQIMNACSCCTRHHRDGPGITALN